jgi:Cof subfamily protein (haloacid dehalogenase superfamily)
MHVRLLGAHLVLALEHPGGDHVGGAKVLLADRTHPAQGGRGTTVGATGDFHDFVLSLGSKNNGVDPFPGAEATAAEGTGLAGGALDDDWLGVRGPLLASQQDKQEGGEQGEDDGHEDGVHEGIIPWYIGPMSHPLFVSDLDGTLLQPDGLLSAFGKATLADFMARGVPFTVASGRSFASIRRALGDTELLLPVISSDGALISAFNDPKPLHLFAMEDGPLDELVADLIDRGHNPFLDLWDGNENFLLSNPPQNPIEEWYHDLKAAERFYKWRHEADLTRPPGAKTISVTILDRPEWLEPLREDLDEKYGAWFKTDYMVVKEMDAGAVLWIQSQDARKEKALEVLGQMLGYQGTDVVVFGDEMNDLGMFGREWHAVAVGNARDELKDKAREVIGHHADDAVLRYILRNLAEG